MRDCLLLGAVRFRSRARLLNNGRSALFDSIEQDPLQVEHESRQNVFAGAFRSWHGAIHLVEAIKVLRARGRRDIGAVLIGDGPELARVKQAADDLT